MDPFSEIRTGRRGNANQHRPEEGLTFLDPDQGDVRCHSQEGQVASSAISIHNPGLEGLLFAGGNQPARRSFGISCVTAGNTPVPVQICETAISPFCTLIEFVTPDISPQADLLVVAPLSGHFPILFRDLVIGLLPLFHVYVTDWHNVRHVSADHGPFGLEANISCVLDVITRRPPGLNVIGICQGGVAALTATAILAQNADRTPTSLILMGAPIDPLANPTRVVKLLRSRLLSWFEQHLIAPVPEEYAGSGRQVYPADRHLIPLWLHLARHLSQGGELSAKVVFDDGADPGRFPFLDLYTSIMDLDAKFFLENTKNVFHDCVLREGKLYFEGERVHLRAIRNTALLTIEGERDDIAAPGQTSAAHALCSTLPERFRSQLVVPGSGHFSLFHGDTWRKAVLPAIRKFCGESRHMEPG
jgi:poly(3-hydroxybutyrate) depolymerase